MTANEATITKFYTAFANADAAKMSECYHSKVQFRDPAFGLLKEDQVSKMWEMLLKKSKGNIKIEFLDVKADDFVGSARWVASYVFSKTNKKVVNHVFAEFQFQDSLIIKHTDTFDVWKWSKQAFGITGYLLGWTGFFQKKIQEQALSSLHNYQSKK